MERGTRGRAEARAPSARREAGDTGDAGGAARSASGTGGTGGTGGNGGDSGIAGDSASSGGGTVAGLAATGADSQTELFGVLGLGMVTVGGLTLAVRRRRVQG